MFSVAAEAGTGVIKFFIAIIIAGFLYAPAPSLVNSTKAFARRVASESGEEFVPLAGATIRTVSRGVIGISALQACLVGMGLLVAGVPGASLITSAVLILGIVRIGPSIVVIPLVIWSWFVMDTSAALLFSAYIDSGQPSGQHLATVRHGTWIAHTDAGDLDRGDRRYLSYGITGLFLGPIILAVIWELVVTWMKETESASATRSKPNPIP